jgi:hypothetical protein
VSSCGARYTKEVVDVDGQVQFHTDNGDRDACGEEGGIRNEYDEYPRDYQDTERQTGWHCELEGSREQLSQCAYYLTTVLPFSSDIDCWNSTSFLSYRQFNERKISKPS